MSVLRKILMGISVITVALVVGFGGKIVYFQLYPKYYDGLGNSHHVTDLKPLQEYSDIIIHAEVIAEGENYLGEHLNLGGNIVPVVGETRTPVKVLKVHKGEELLKGKDEIIIVEPHFTQTHKDYTKSIVSVEYYRPMKKGQEYLLFLSPDPTRGENFFGGNTLRYSKYPMNKKKLETDEQIDQASPSDIELGTDDKDYKNILKQIRKEY